MGQGTKHLGQWGFLALASLLEESCISVLLSLSLSGHGAKHNPALIC